MSKINEIDKLSICVIDIKISVM